jgi:hypothetical protein
MSRIFVVPHAGYPFDVAVAIGATDEQVREFLEKGTNLSTEEIANIKMHQAGKGRTVMLTSGQTVLRLQKWEATPDDTATLAHEVFHAVTFLMERIGITFCAASDEAYAYAIGNLTLRIVTELEKS